MRLGRSADVLAALESAGRQRPLSERVAGLRMRALSAAGRQSDAPAIPVGLLGMCAPEPQVDCPSELATGGYLQLAVLPQMVRSLRTVPAGARR
nr:BTAD domain-containing putative transcriptional regulator [Streptomyces sp. SID14478]